jgi:hypothetical protein
MAVRERTTATLDPTRTEHGFTGPTLGVARIVTISGGLPDDATLIALAGLDAAPGLVEQTGLDTFTKRPIGISTPASIPTLANNDARYAALAHNHVAASITDLQEVIEDFIGSSLLAGTNVAISYNDTTGKTTVSSLGGGTGGGGSGAALISDTPPASPTNGQTWWESDTGKYFISYDDGTSVQWVQINGGGGSVDAYTKLESDLRYEPLDSAYTKTESDARYEPLDSAYTKVEADAKFVDVAGDTMSGALTVNNGITSKGGVSGGYGRLTVDDDGGSFNSAVSFRHGGVLGWDIQYRGSANVISFDAAVLNTATVSIPGTTPSTSPTTGALTVAGGVGIGGRLSVGTFPQANPTVSQAVSFTGAGSQYGMSFRPAADGTTAIFFSNAAGTGIGEIAISAVATAYVTSSDGRLKDDLKTFDSGALIDRLEPVDFRWKETGERAYGVIAQDAAKVVPQACHYDEQSDRWGVDYSKYVPLLLAELKAVRVRLAVLEGRR